MRPGFYNDNLNRDYPFLHLETGTLPDSAIADFGSIMGASSGFVEGEHTIKLYRIRSVGSVVEYEFTCDATGLTDYVLRFERNTTDTLYTTSFAVAVPSSGSSTIDCMLSCESTPCNSLTEDSCSGDHIWSGFLVTGKFDELLDQLDSSVVSCGEVDTTVLSKVFNIPVEPSVIVNLSKSYVKSVSVANAERTRSQTPQGCREYCWPFPLQDHYVNCECIVGAVRFEEGYNCKITQNDLENSITINAQLGAGQGQACTDVPIFDEEEPPQGRTTLSGALKCSEVIRTINGVSQRFYEILGGSGVTVTPYPDEHKIVIDINLHNMAVCGQFKDQLQYSSSSINPDPCDCGPESA